MKVPINLTNYSLTGCTIENIYSKDCSFSMKLGMQKGGVILAGKPGCPDGNNWSDYKYIVADIYNPQPYEELLLFEFWEISDPDNKPRFSTNRRLFPMAKARIVFELKRLDSQLLFPPLTPGSLKAGVSGDRTDLAAIDRFSIALSKGYTGERSFEIRSLYITDEYPEFPAPEKTTTDELGQWSEKEWPGKTAGAEELRLNLQKAVQECKGAGYPEEWDRYGGCKAIKLAGEGYFRVVNEHGRWWFVDPDGNAFFSTGVFGVYPGEPGWILGNEGYHSWLPPKDGEFAPAWTNVSESELYRRKFSGMFPEDTGMFSFATANLIRAFGADWYKKWSVLTASRLRTWGVNTLSMFSDPQFIKDSAMPFVIMLKGYPTTEKSIFREFPDVYSPEYSSKCEVFARQLEEYAENRNLIGYFLNNEPTWGFVKDLVLAEKLLENDDRTASRDVLIKFLSERYDGEIAKFNQAWKLALGEFNQLYAPIYRASQLSSDAHRDLEDFSLQMILRYAQLPSEAARRAAPNHLNLGMRFAEVNGSALIQTCKFFDVYSFNCYRDNAHEVIDRISPEINKPMLIGEFHFGALDRGLPAPSLFCVATQQERAAAYSRYMDGLALNQYAVGAHYFAYNDQPLWGRYDGENYQFGFVDICNTPYQEFTEGLSNTNRTIYSLICGRRKAYGGQTIRL